MTRIEQRKLERYPLERQPGGEVALVIGADRYRVDEIKDISDFGISFFLDQSVPVSSRVAVAYADDSVKLEVYGRVAWCSKLKHRESAPAQAERFVMGVELLNPATLYAMLQRH